MLKTALFLLLIGSLTSLFGASCTSDTIQDYSADFGNAATNCSIGILLYNNFSFSGVPAGATLTLSPNADLGFNFTLTAANGSPYQATTDTTFSVIYEFTIDPAPILSGSGLKIDPSGDVTISQVFCLDSNPTAGFSGCLAIGAPVSPQTLSVESTGGQNASNSITFNPPATSFGWVETTFNLDPDGSPYASFESVDSTPDVTVGGLQIVIPEPVSVALMGLGLIALAGAKLKRRQH